ncbi:MAG: hypothetical protein AAF184_09550 [Pseudomonadota bacterium]
MPPASNVFHDEHRPCSPRARWLGVLCLCLSAAPLAAQTPYVLHRDLPPAADTDLRQAYLPPQRLQVPFASSVEDEVVVYGRREPLGLPDSVRTEIWRSQQRELRAMMIERERMANKIPLEGFDALLGTHLRVRLLPTYDPLSERRLEYRINDSMPVGLIELFCMALEQNREFRKIWPTD